MPETKTIAKDRKLDKTETITLSDLIRHVAFSLNCDGTLLKSAFDHGWNDLCYELKTNKELSLMPGRPTVLNEVIFSSYGPFPLSEEVSEVMRRINFGSATALGELAEHGWFINKRIGDKIQKELDEILLVEYKEFVEKATEIAKSYVATGENIVDYLPSNLRKLIRS